MLGWIMLTALSNIERIAATRGMYIDDFYRLCRFHQMSTGNADDLNQLEKSLSSRSAFRSDFFRLAGSINRKEQGAMSIPDLVTVVALALSGNEISRGGEFVVPANLIETFTAGLIAEDQRMRRQEEDLDALQTELTPSGARPVDPSNALEIPRRESHRSEPAETRNDKIGSPKAGLHPVQPQEPGVPYPGMTRAAATVAEAVQIAHPEVVESLERIEWMGIALEHRIKDIERYISRMAPDPDYPRIADRSATNGPPSVPPALLPNSAISFDPSHGEPEVYIEPRARNADKHDARLACLGVASARFADAPPPAGAAAHSEDLRVLSPPSEAPSESEIPEKEVRHLSYPAVAIAILLICILGAMVEFGQSYFASTRPAATKVISRTASTNSPGGSAAAADGAGADQSANPDEFSGPNLSHRRSPIPMIEHRVSAAQPTRTASEQVPSIHSPKGSVPALDKQEQAAAEKAVTETISGWAEAAKSNDVEGETSFYAPTLDRYFLRRGVSKQFIQRDKESYRARGNSIQSFNVSDLNFESVSDASVVVSLAKSWRVVGPSDTGEKVHYTRSRLWLERGRQGWKIVGEQDLKD